ncbi:MAG: hypothetical protein RugAbin2_01873 [Rugosibacter sp.]|jgi:hypothetical protein|nr:hypothetical protein [Rugosibacter sp.]
MAEKQGVHAMTKKLCRSIMLLAHGQVSCVSLGAWPPVLFCAWRTALRRQRDDAVEDNPFI